METDLSGSLAAWAVLVVCLASLPFAVRWLVRKKSWGPMAPSATRILASLPLGPQQKVVTLEMGPEDARFQLILGVTPQAITCLHKMALAPDERTHVPD
jgi:flagellar protein FliO/FliZ